MNIRRIIMILVWAGGMTTMLLQPAPVARPVITGPTDDQSMAGPQNPLSSPVANNPHVIYPESGTHPRPSVRVVGRGTHAPAHDSGSGFRTGQRASTP